MTLHARLKQVRRFAPNSLGASIQNPQSKIQNRKPPANLSFVTGSITPRSQMIAAISRAGVTSKAGL